MRFFTMVWWGGDHKGDDPIPAYAVHLAAIRDRLPPDLLATQESFSLHDARLRELRLSLKDRSLRIALESYAGDEHLTLIYSGVDRFDSFADPNVYLGGPGGYGDLGYCEVDVLPSGTFEHRILFSTGIELAVEFQGFQLLRG